MRNLFSMKSLVAVAVALVACGGGSSSSTTKTPSGSGSTSAGTTAEGGVIGMSDTPSSVKPGEVPDADVPQMNATAAGHYKQGITAFASGDLVTAKKFFGEAISADPKAHQAYYSLGTTQERLRDPGAAASYKQAIALVPKYEPAIIAYSILLSRKGQLGEADRFLTQKRGEMPKSAAVVAALAEVKSLQKDHGTAQRLAQEALKLNPDYRRAMVVIARDHYRARRLDNALHALQAILDGFEPVSENPPRDKGNPEAHLIRGLIFREQGKRQLAIEEFRKAVAGRPDFVEARVALSTYLLEAGSAEEALPHLEAAVRFDAENVPARLNLGDTYRLLGRYGEAKREFDWVVSRDPSMPQVHYDLALLYLYAPSIPGMTMKQQIAEATKELKKYQELRPKDAQDDSNELLNIAKVKEGELQAAAAAAAPVPAAPAATGTAKPAASAAPAGKK